MNHTLLFILTLKLYVSKKFFLNHFFYTKLIQDEDSKYYNKRNFFVLHKWMSRIVYNWKLPKHPSYKRFRFKTGNHVIKFTKTVRSLSILFYIKKSIKDFGTKSKSYQLYLNLGLNVLQLLMDQLKIQTEQLQPIR